MSFLSRIGPSPCPFEVGSHDDREFGGDVVRIRNRTHHAERLEATGFALADGDERHFPIVVNLRQTRELRRLQLTHVHEDSIADILRIERIEELDVLRTVLRL